MTRNLSTTNTRRLPPRDPRGGRPPRQIAAQLGSHILEVALEQFIAHGVEGASMEAIAEAAKVSKRTLYARFGSKTGLLVATVEHGFARYLKPIKTAVPAGTARETLLYVARRMLDASLTQETIGLETLYLWLARHEPAIAKLNPRLGTRAVSAAFQTIIEQAGPGEEADVQFLAGFIYDTLVSAPRTRILVRKELDNSPEAKTDYLERATTLVVRAMPFLDDEQSGARSIPPR